MSFCNSKKKKYKILTPAQLAWRYKHKENIESFLRSKFHYEGDECKENSLYCLVDCFTLNTTDETEFLNAFKYFQNLHPTYFKRLELNNNSFKIDSSDGEIYVKKLIECFDKTKKLPDEIKELETKERRGKCHHYALFFAMSLNSKDTNIVTAWVDSRSDKYKYLHSWVEISKPDGTVDVLDATIGAIMDRTIYYKMMKPIDINYISASDIKQDFEDPKFVNLASYIKKYGYNSKLTTKWYLHNRESFLNFINEIEK